METEMNPLQPTISKNLGWFSRSCLLKKDEISTEEYRKEGTTFLGRLNHELTTTEKPLPPQMLVQITLNRSSDNFFIMKQSDDTKNYKAVVTYCCLYVPIAFMQLEMLRELEIRWPKEPITYHYRRHNILKLSVHRNKKEYFSDALFAESENPIRIFLFLVETDSVLGTQTSNPYNFGRTWKYKTSISRLSLEDQLEEKHTQNELSNIKQMISQLLSRMQEAQTPIAQPAQPTQPALDPEEQPLGKGKKGSPIKRTTRSNAESSLSQPTPGTSGTSLFNSMANIFRRNSQTPSEEDEFEVIPDASLAQLENAAEMINNQIEKERSKQGSSARSSHSIRESDSVSVASGQRTGNLGLIGVNEDTFSTFWLEKCQLELNSQPLG